MFLPPLDGLVFVLKQSLHLLFQLPLLIYQSLHFRLELSNLDLGRLQPSHLLFLVGKGLLDLLTGTPQQVIFTDFVHFHLRFLVTRYGLFSHFHGGRTEVLRIVGSESFAQLLGGLVAPLIGLLCLMAHLDRVVFISHCSRVQPTPRSKILNGRLLRLQTAELSDRNLVISAQSEVFIFVELRKSATVFVRQLAYFHLTLVTSTDGPLAALLTRRLSFKKSHIWLNIGLS